MAVKFLWPVGGALMQCFKARDLSWKREHGGREGDEAKGERMLQQAPNRSIRPLNSPQVL